MLPFLFLLFHDSRSVLSSIPESRDVPPSSSLGSAVPPLDVALHSSECHRETSGLVVCSSVIPEGGCFQSPALKDRFQIEEPTCLGRGCFGVVERGIDLETAEPVAVKTSRMNSDERITAASLRREAELSLELSSHPKLVNTLLAVVHEDGTCLVMKRYEGTLEEWLSKTQRLCSFGRWMDESAARAVFKQVVEGVASMHSCGPRRQGVAHNDLKPDNILIEQGGEDEGAPRVVLGDFGLSQKFEKREGRQKANPIGHSRYIPPRLDEGKGSGAWVPVTERDLYALGVILYDMLHDPLYPLIFVPPRLAPQVHVSRIAMFRKVPIFDRFRLSNLVADLLTKLLTGDRDFVEGGGRAVLHHPWFSASRAALVQQAQANLWDEGLFRLSVLQKEDDAPFLEKIREQMRRATGRLLVPPTSLRYSMRSLHAYLPSSGVDFSSGSVARSTQ